MLCMDGSDCFCSVMLLLMLSFSLAMGDSWVVLNVFCSGSTLSTFCLEELAFCCG